MASGQPSPCLQSLALIGLLSEIAETPVFIGISSAENKSHNGVTTESERSQNRGRAYEGQTGEHLSPSFRGTFWEHSVHT